MVYAHDALIGTTCRVAVARKIAVRASLITESYRS